MALLITHCQLWQHKCSNSVYFLVLQTLVHGSKFGFTDIKCWHKMGMGPRWIFGSRLLPVTQKSAKIGERFSSENFSEFLILTKLPVAQSADPERS